MSNNIVNNTPKFRFPEFQNNGEWEEKKLLQIAKKINSKNKNLEVDFVLTNSASEGIVSQRDYFKKDIANKNNLGGYYIVEVNDFIYNPRISSKALVGSLKRNKLSKGIMSPLYIVMRFKEGNLSFYEHYFEATHWHNYMRSIANMGAKFDRLNLNSKQFFDLPLPSPHLKEQQKVANCIDSIDSLIFASAQKLDLLNDHKKGLLQSLFPNNGKSIPNIRFPEFENDGEWEETSIGNIGSFYYGKSAPKWSLEEDAPTACVRYGELYSTFGSIITETYSRTNIEPEKLRFSKGGEILVPRVGENPYDFGKCCCYLPLKNIAIGEMISVFETSQNPLFYTYYFKSLYREFAKVVEGQNVKNLYYVELEPIKIYLTSPQEQQKIADCLLSIDEQINFQIQKLQSFKEHKKSLLQQLFPSRKES